MGPSPGHANEAARWHKLSGPDDGRLQPLYPGDRGGVRHHRPDHAWDLLQVIPIAVSTDNGPGTIAALVVVAVAAILLPIGHLLIAKHMKLFENAIKIATRLGGILILTIGVQLVLGGIKTFFGV